MADRCRHKLEIHNPLDPTKEYQQIYDGIKAVVRKVGGKIERPENDQPFIVVFPAGLGLAAFGKVCNAITDATGHDMKFHQRIGFPPDPPVEIPEDPNYKSQEDLARSFPFVTVGMFWWELAGYESSEEYYAAQSGS
ncbi:MAG: hypothetical protein NTW79_01560 [Candidatus Berkelbacteria bacterium]|nr:hypothetical protein [Candidatus Berkelbacteria bacterium]